MGHYQFSCFVQCDIENELATSKKKNPNNFIFYSIHRIWDEVINHIDDYQNLLGSLNIRT